MLLKIVQHSRIANTIVGTLETNKKGKYFSTNFTALVSQALFVI